LNADEIQVRVTPAAEVVCRFANALVLVAPGPNVHGWVVDAVVQICRDASSEPRALIEQLTAVIDAAPPEAVPDLAIVLREGAALVAIARGAMAVTAPGEGVRLVPVVAPAPPEVAPLAETAPPTPAFAPEVAPAPPNLTAQSAAPAQPAGATPAAGAVRLVELTGAADEHAREPLPVGGVDAADEGPVVFGIRCKRGHFNRPDALFCGVCGISTVHETQAPVRGPRPNLGHLVLDDGSVFQLTHDYVIGSAPEIDPSVASGAALPLAMTDAQASVSHVHAFLTLRDWDVYVEDRGSTNGSFVWAESGQWVRLAPATATKLNAGNHVAVGSRTFRFEPANTR